MTYYSNGTELALVFSNNSHQSLADIKKVVDTILNVEGYTFDVLCTYPINGQYGVLPRTLYYGLLVFSLFFRSHNWIAAACLGVAFTYSGTTAIHAFAMATRFKFDHYGGVHKEHIVASDLGDLDMNAIWVILSTGGLMLTPPQLVGHAAQQGQGHNCLLGVTVVCRINLCLVDNMPYVKPTKAMKIIATEPFERVKKLNEFYVIFVAIQGFLGLLQAYSTEGTQEKIRNRIFHLIEPTAATANQRQPSIHRMRQRLAKWVAATFYLVSVFMAICCPIFFISNIVVQEILLIQYPVSEPIWSIGQWSAYSALGLAVIAAIIDKFNTPMWNVIALCVNRLTSKTKFVPTTPSFKYSGFDEVLWKSWILFQAPFRSVVRQTRWKILHLSWEVHDFRIWYRDPANYPACDCESKCDCKVCKTLEEVKSSSSLKKSSDLVKQEAMFELPKSHRDRKVASVTPASDTDNSVTIVKNIELSPHDTELLVLGKASREQKRGSATF